MFKAWMVKTGTSWRAGTVTISRKSVRGPGPWGMEDTAEVEGPGAEGKGEQKAEGFELDSFLIL